jgi:hypothetical protein
VRSHRKHEIAAIVVLVLGVAAYASFRSEFRLRADMPPEFFESSSVPVQRRHAEQLIAKAYWDCAVKQIQWKYGYAHRLPEEPPQEFSVAPGRQGSEGAEREFYWRRLRSAWGNSSAWEKKYEWNTISLTDSLRSAAQWLETHMRRIVGYS